MKEKLIQNYINNLTKNDINTFAQQNNIILDNKETDYLYNLIKNEWKKLIFGNPKEIFNQLQTVLKKDKYTQLYQLYQTYKNKYSHYL